MKIGLESAGAKPRSAPKTPGSTPETVLLDASVSSPVDYVLSGLPEDPGVSYSETHEYPLGVGFSDSWTGTIHTTLRVTPCMAAGVTARVWEIADLVKLLDRPAAAPDSN